MAKASSIFKNFATFFTNPPGGSATSGSFGPDPKDLARRRRDAGIAARLGQAWG